MPTKRWAALARERRADELRTAPARHCGNIAAVARLFGRERARIHRWMKRYGIDADGLR
ncbi:hypothetical protein WME88_56085 [Sorangium sp. So ce216]